MSGNKSRTNLFEMPNPYSKGALGSFSWINRNLAKKREGKLAYLSVSINDECNLECPGCIIRDWELSEEGVSEGLLEQRIREAEIEDIAGVPVTYVSISGKEPTTTPGRLVEVSKISASEGKKVVLMTNSTQLSPKLQEQLRGVVDYCDPSFDVEGPKGIEEALKENKAFARSWQNIRYAAEQDVFERIGIISTLNSQTCSRASELMDFLERGLGEKERVKMTINFHLGLPGDPLMLDESQFIETVKEVAKGDYKTNIIVPLAYSRFLPKLFEELEVDRGTKRHCSDTGLVSYELKGHLLIPFVHLENPVYGLRVEHDGNVYFGCSHMMFKGKTDQWSLGNIKRESLPAILTKMVKGESELFEKMHYINPACQDKACYGLCRAGDRVAGLYLKRKAVDPFCEKVN